MKANHLLLGVLAIATTALAACGGSTDPEAPISTPSATASATQSPLQPSARQILHNHVPAAVSSGTAALIGPLPAMQRLKVSFVLPLRNQAALTRLLDELYDPQSPNYRQFLSVAQFTAQFGPTVEDFQAVVDFAQANGFTVTDTPENRLIVPIEGAVDQIEKAFNVALNVHQHPTEKRTFFSPDHDPSLALSVPVAHIVGLDDFSMPRHTPVKTSAAQAIAEIVGSGPGGNSYLGSDLRAAYYGGTALTGSGQVVGLFEIGGYNISDVNLTFSNAGQAYSVPINNVLVDGASAAPQGEDAEQVLDIVAAIGMAPGLSQVRVYIGGGIVDTLNKMATENIAKQISTSFAWPDDAPNASVTVDPIFQQMAAQGQSFFAATGDFGSYPNAAPTYFPAEDAFVTAVGGTDLTTNTAGGSWLSETAWISSGGGISPDGIPIPSWQAGVASTSNGGSATLRDVPDVAALANPTLYLCEMGQCSLWGGTSLATPLWAGFMALVNQQAVEAGKAPLGGIGFINPAVYTIGKGASYSTDFHDIASGTNGALTAVTGYDLVTGWGSPHGQSLINALAGSPAAGFTLTNSAVLSGLSVKPGASGTATITVNELDGFTGSVTLAASGLPTGVTAKFGTSPTTGTSVLTLTASSSVAFTTANVTITGTSGSRTATTSLALTISAPHFALAVGPTILSLNQGSTGSATVTVTDLAGFTGKVTLAVSGLPTGVTGSFGTNPATGTSVLTLSASGTATTGSPVANLVITGTSGTLTASTNLELDVVQPFQLFEGNGSLTISQGGSTTGVFVVLENNGFTGTVNLSVSGLPSGVTATLTPNPTTGTENGVLALTASSTATLGTAVVLVTATSGTVSEGAAYILTVDPATTTFTLAASPSSVSVAQGASGTSTITVTDVGGFTGAVTLAASGLPSGVTASFTLNPTTGTSVLTLTASGAATAGTSTLTITGTSGSLTESTSLGLTVTPVSSGSACTVDYTISPQNSSAFGGAITINNTGTVALTSWTLTWSFADGQTVAQLWNGAETQTGANVTVTNESYNGSIAPGASYGGVGFNGAWNGATNAIPTSFTLNGMTCTVN